MDIGKILKDMGYKNLLSDDWYGRINTWLDWYGGITSFHKYSVYNGQKTVQRTRASLEMAKKVCEDKADLLLNERVEIKVEDDTAQEFLDSVFARNNFWLRGNQLIELANAVGTGAFVEYMEGGEIAIDYVTAQSIRPISWKNRTITECAFVSTVTISGEQLTYIQRHILENDLYVIYNDLFDDKDVVVDLPENVLPKWETGSDIPMFQIVTPNIANSYEITNPMGISCFASAIDVLKGIDLVYDSMSNEFILGKKRIFVDDSVTKANLEDGKLIPIFDPNETVFYGIPGKENDKSITESDMHLRVTDHKEALQENLDLLSEKCGFGKGYYRFDADSVQTATAVISQNSKLFRRIRKDEIVLHNTLTGLVQAILSLGNYKPQDISISFDDSIIEDTDAKMKRALLEYNADIIDSVAYFMRVYDMTEDAATKQVEKINKRKNGE